MLVKTTILQNHNTLPFGHLGQDTYIAGKNGCPYTIRLENLTPQRIMVVLTVDGKNVIDGRPGSFDGQGYVLSPYQTTDIKGWRETDHKVAQFKFCDPGDSYAAQTGAPENIGVIGMAAFTEYVLRPSPTYIVPKLWSGDGLEGGLEGSTMTCSVGQPRLRSVQSIGTGYGKSVTSRVSHTNFQRASSTPDQTMVIRYNTAARLREMGVKFDVGVPNPFPGKYTQAPPKRV